MKFFDENEITQAISYTELVAKLRYSFQEKYEVPDRIHYQFRSGQGHEDSTLLLMPAWQDEQYVGLKLLTVSPQNDGKKLPTIQGIYVLADAKNGAILAQFDAKSLTNLRTASASALASEYLSREKASSMLMLGTGALAPHMIKAHCAVRPIEQVLVWGRNLEKAGKLCAELNIPGVEIVPIQSIEQNISNVDIISTATSSEYPLVLGRDLRAGQHVDLVGAFKPTWREADDLVIKDSSVFVDTRGGTLKESGELLIPMKKGLINEKHIKADLFDLCNGAHKGRTNEQEVTCFISVGYALEDLAACELVWKKFLKE